MPTNKIKALRNKGKVAHQNYKTTTPRVNHDCKVWINNISLINIATKSSKSVILNFHPLKFFC